MLIKANNPELFRKWLEYLGNDTAAKRTQAFFNSQANRAIPFYR